MHIACKGTTSQARIDRFCFTQIYPGGFRVHGELVQAAMLAFRKDFPGVIHAQRCERFNRGGNLDPLSVEHRAQGSGVGEPTQSDRHDESQYEKKDGDDP